jgi:Signal transduction histidine kinase involved in nitrogen fixation and metabolism regulation
MAHPLLKRFASNGTRRVGLFLLLLVSLYLMSDATQNSTRFGALYSWLLLLNALGLVILTALIATNLLRLARQYQRRTAGARLTVRLVIMFVVLAVAPVSVVYYFSLQFLKRGIDSWFDVRIEKALEDALELSRSALDLRTRELVKQSRLLAAELGDVTDASAALRLGEMRERIGADELILLAQNGHIVALSSADPTVIVPNQPSEAILSQLRQGQPYVGLDPIRDTGLHVRVVVPVSNGGSPSDSRILQALYPVPARLSTLADSVQLAFGRYKELAYLRKPLKQSFVLTLSLVLLLSLLSAVWSAFYSARRLVAPIRDLAGGTRAVADGDYSTQLPVATHDELGYLVESFNDMTQRLGQARDEARRSQQELESQRAYLEAVLAHLSSGVLTLDKNHTLSTANEAAGQILGVGLTPYIGRRLEDVGNDHTPFKHLCDALAQHLDRTEREWREEIMLFGAGGRKVLMCRGTRLPSEASMWDGHVIVFDDITRLIQAQRDAAWSEVARRLAHEIKNPLTPIRLSAERLRRKYLGKMDAQDGQVLDRSTHTIVQQVEALQEMVNAFTEYARAPRTKLVPLNLNHLVSDVMELYRGPGSGIRVDLRLDPQAPIVEADAGRLRQLLHNLAKNALEATGKRRGSRLMLVTRCLENGGRRLVELSVRDNGPGFHKDILNQLFEPYVTTKAKGSGLGLAIVKKIVEEHGGMIWAENLKQGGAGLFIRLPILENAEGSAGSCVSVPPLDATRERSN